MNVQPIIARELRVKARSPHLRWPRLIMAALALLIVTWLQFLPQWFGAAMPPSMALVLGFQLAFLAALFMGARLTADALSQEYREKTLGLLFLSHLRGWEIAVGKLTSHTVTALFTLLATVPILSIPLMTGGMSGSAVLRLSLAILSALVFSAAIGLFFSSLTESGRKAWSLSLFTLLGLTIAWPVVINLGIAVASRKGLSPPAWTGHLTLLSPCPANGLSLANRGNPGGRTGGQLLAGTRYTAVHYLGSGASRRLQCRPAEYRTPLEHSRFRPPRTLAAMAAGRFHRPIGSTESVAGPQCVRLADQSLPVSRFLAIRADRQPPASARGAVGSLALPGRAVGRSRALAVGLSHLLLKFHFGVEAVLPILTERRSGTVEVLLSTPLTNRQMMTGQRQALVRQFTPALVLAGLATLGLLLFIPDAADPGERRWLIVLPLAATAALLADFWTMIWLGMWCATWKNAPRRAAGNTAGFVLVLPWLALIALSLTLALIAVSRGNAGGTFEPDPWGFFGAWALFGLGNNLFWLILSRRVLRRRLRALLGVPVAPLDL